MRTQFQQPTKIGQQILVNQAAPQTTQPQRAQIGQQLWTQQPSQVTGQQIIRHPVNVIQQGPRVQWSPNSQQGKLLLSLKSQNFFNSSCLFYPPLQSGVRCPKS